MGRAPGKGGDAPVSRYRNELAGRREAIRALWVAVGVALVCAVLMAVGWMSAPSSIRIHIPPDLSAGAMVAPDDPGPPHVYTFGFYLWQQLYRWPVNGAEDYPARIDSLVHYLTPSCYEDRREDVEVRRRQRELAGRRRAVWEIPGRGYSVDRVHAEGAGSWVVLLDLQIEETMLGQPVKTRLASYPVRVVRYRVDPELNPWGLAIDCLARPPVPIGVGGGS